jgi:hypothetical protein
MNVGYHQFHAFYSSAVKRRKTPRSIAWQGELPCFVCMDLLCLGKGTRMILDQAKKLVKECAEQMHARYGKVVFDEWAIVSLADNKGRVLAYIGPRKQGFKENFLADAGSLRTGLLNAQHAVGDFDFSRYGVGTGFESFMVLGQRIYLICNNTVQSMETISKDPLWIGAQVPFVELSEKFRADPLVDSK